MRDFIRIWVFVCLVAVGRILLIRRSRFWVRTGLILWMIRYVLRVSFVRFRDLNRGFVIVGVGGRVFFVLNVRFV